MVAWCKRPLWTASLVGQEMASRYSYTVDGLLGGSYIPNTMRTSVFSSESITPVSDKTKEVGINHGCNVTQWECEYAILNRREKVRSDHLVSETLRLKLSTPLTRDKTCTNQGYSQSVRSCPFISRLSTIRSLLGNQRKGILQPVQSWPIKCR